MTRPDDNTSSTVETFDIGSAERGPAAALSNFTAHSFVFRGAEIASMEALLQSLKCPSPQLQSEIWKLSGNSAKRAGSIFPWGDNQVVYWRGEALDRHGPRYQELLDEAYAALFEQNDEARAALLMTGDLVLTHTIGKADPRQTILTRNEFCSRLEQIRRELRNAERSA